MGLIDGPDESPQKDEKTNTLGPQAARKKHYHINYSWPWTVY